MDLPFEVLVYLFKYLPKSDRKAASEACHDWYAAANASCFLDRKLVLFYKSIINNEKNSPLETYANSLTDYNRYFFSDSEITSKAMDYWKEIGENVRSLTLRNCDIREKVFLQMLQNSPSLEELNIQCCKELFMSGRLLEGESEGLLQDSLAKLQALGLSSNQYLTDALFHRFIRAAPALEVLNLSDCALQFHRGLVKKFYPPNIDAEANPSESVFTFYFILQFISSKAKFLKHLLLANTLIDGVALRTLSEVKHLKLESLDLYKCDQLTNAGIVALAANQPFLKKLNIGMCSRVTDQSLIHICNNLHDLEMLNIQRCRAVTDMGVSEMYKLKKLENLNISQCELITIEGVQSGICAKVNNVLRVLDIHSLNIDEAGLVLISSRLPQLIYLDVSYCFNGVTDTSIQEIIKNQLLLRTLKLSHCDKVSDAGLTGMGKVDTDETENTCVSNNNERTHHRIYLGSRAEGEIIRDARRKQDVMRMCEKLSTDTFSGYCLANLKGLRELDISGCNRITDVSLTYAFSFIELAVLNMSHCQQVTHEGVEHLVKNCPSIEYLDVIDCYNLDDGALKITVKGLKRLKYLQLKGCSQLTDRTLEAIRDNCTKLQLLDVQGCRHVSCELACSLGAALPSLHTVLMSKPGPYITDGVKNRTPAPAPAFLPALMRKLLSRRTPDRHAQ